MAGVPRIAILLGLLYFSQCTISPRTSFHIGSPGRLVSMYKRPDLRNITALLLSPDSTTLFVGAQNTVLSLDVSQPGIISLKNKYDWAPLTRERCGTSKDCTNFIRVLQFINSTHLYACGSVAFQPQDIILTVDTLSVSRKAQPAKGLCPYKVSQSSTAIFVDGQMYTATVENFSGSMPVISRQLILDQLGKRQKNLQLHGISPILNDPTFVSSHFIPSEGKVLFFFTEKGAEYSFMEPFTVSRVAQVCTDDNGGERVLQKSWTTFAKSQLKCQMEKELPFSLLQDVVMVPPEDDASPDKTMFYGIFTSQWALVAGQTAVCAFTLEMIKNVFSKDYKTYNSETNQWNNQRNIDAKLGKCGLHNESDSTLNMVKKTYLTAQSIDNKPLLTTKEQLYSRIAAQRVQTANGSSYTVLYMLTETGFLHKAVLLKNKLHIIEEIQVFKPPQMIKTLLLSVPKNVLFVGFAEGVIRVPVSNCTCYSSCAECVLAQDPFCGWDSQGKGCIPVTDMNTSLHQDVENGNVKEQCTDQENEDRTVFPNVHTEYLNEDVQKKSYYNEMVAVSILLALCLCALSVSVVLQRRKYCN